jgi:hypothetical protein
MSAGGVEHFLRHAIQPPLTTIEEVVAAVPGSGVTMAHLVRASPRGGGTASRFAEPSWKVSLLMDGLKIATVADKLAFVDALEDLGAAAGPQ